jgi:hypothetical protein
MATLVEYSRQLAGDDTHRWTEAVDVTRRLVYDANVWTDSVGTDGGQQVLFETLALAVYIVAVQHDSDPATVPLAELVAWFDAYPRPRVQFDRYGAERDAAIASVQSTLDRQLDDMRQVLTAAGHAPCEPGMRTRTLPPGRGPVERVWQEMVTWEPPEPGDGDDPFSYVGVQPIPYGLRMAASIVHELNA